MVQKMLRMFDCSGKCRYLAGQNVVIMKQIYLVLVMCAALPMLLLCRCSCQSGNAQVSDISVVSDGQHCDSVVVISEDSAQVLTRQKVIDERRRDNAACVPEGNYYKFQPGLLAIVNQIFTNDEFRKAMDYNTRMDAYPQLLREKVNPSLFQETDTFKYNWRNDTIICVNLWRRDVECIGGRAGDCKLISSQDTLWAYGYQPEVDIERFKIYMNPEVKAIYYGIMRRWDKEGLDSICEYEGIICDGAVHGLSRWVIKDGVLLDLKYLRCEHISEHKILKGLINRRKVNNR